MPGHSPTYKIATFPGTSRGSDINEAAYLQTDGERLPLAVKDLGSCDLYPQSLAHNPNGRFVTVCGDGEYITYTALAWRNKSFGPALEFVWGEDSSVFATRESASSVKVRWLDASRQTLLQTELPCHFQGIYLKAAACTYQDTAFPPGRAVMMCRSCLPGAICEAIALSQSPKAHLCLGHQLPPETKQPAIQSYLPALTGPLPNLVF